MFINYFKQPIRSSPFNLFVGRVVLGLYAIWKLLSYDFNKLKEWPSFLFHDHVHRLFLLSDDYLDFIWIEEYIIILLLFFLIIGYRIKLVAFLSALFIAHISGLHYVVTNSGATWLPVIYILLLFAVCSHTDLISIDGIRKTKLKSIASLNDDLRKESSYDMAILKWALPVIALTYAFNGFSKLFKIGFFWGTSDYLTLLLHRELLLHLNELSFISHLIMSHSWLAFMSATLTLILECGFVFVVLFFRRIDLFVIGLLAMHLLIYVTMEILFFDQFIFFALFIPWDKLYAKVASKSKLKIVYDNNCYFCARSLYIFKQLDINGTIEFYFSEDRPEEFEKVQNHEFNKAMYLAGGQKVYRGYYAFRNLIHHFNIFLPVVLFMKIHFVEKIGEKLYNYIAANRDTIAVCAVTEN